MLNMEYKITSLRRLKFKKGSFQRKCNVNGYTFVFFIIFPTEDV